ncbi:MAG: sugar transferase, partial [Bacteroidales bacterium]|nr:sugar transferase [Bacteroidales bacterium]
MYAPKTKRFLDIVCAGLLLVPCTPIVLLTMLVSCCVQRSFRGFFIQTRLGYRTRPFKIIKLRTMSNETDGDGQLLPDE